MQSRSSVIVPHSCELGPFFTREVIRIVSKSKSFSPLLLKAATVLGRTIKNVTAALNGDADALQYLYCTTWKPDQIKTIIKRAKFHLDSDVYFL